MKTATLEISLFYKKKTFKNVENISIIYNISYISHTRIQVEAENVYCQLLESQLLCDLILILR